MSKLRRVAAAARRCVVWLMPDRRREWAEALWAEALWAEALWAETGAVPPGRQRLAGRAGGRTAAGRGPDPERAPGAARAAVRGGGRADGPGGLAGRGRR